MRLLFVSGTVGGGSGRSQRELTKALGGLGHDISFLVDDKGSAAVTRWAYSHLSDASVRASGGPAAPLVEHLRDSLGRRIVDRDIDGIAHGTSPIPQNALVTAVRDQSPDVVVVNSVERWAWRRIHATCQAAGIPTVLYLREEDSMAHLDTGSIPTVLVANAVSIAERMRARGHPCTFVPSVVDTTVTDTVSTRRAALSINPIPSKGGDLIWSIASRLPHVPFIVQESWPLRGDDLSKVQANADSLPNVEFRRRVAPGPALYGDARLLLVPYRVDSRPRVILEAQANGIPVVVGDVPALVEAMGEGGVSVPLESVDDWVETVRVLWADAERYAALSAAAAEHGRRAEVDPRTVAQEFEDVLRRAVASTSA
jgi:glycosyltransferase involved in cell wall biosynthesis